MSNKKSIGIIVSLWLVALMVACVGEREQLVSPSPQYDLTYPPTSTVLPTFTTSPTSVPTVTVSPTFSPTVTDTVAQVLSDTLTPTFTLTPTCELYDNGEKWCILHNDVFFHQGPRAAEIDDALAETFPNWWSFRQSLEWRAEPASVGEIIKDASFDVEFDLNPAVTLVTVGMLLDWQLPSDGDLFSLAHEVADELNSLYYDYYFDKEGVQGVHLEVQNAATYAIYAFFDYDQVRLGEWCIVYSKLYRQSPLCIP